MAKNSFIGARLRRLRKDKRLAQIDLAAQLGISASYLNLIEHDRRDLTVPLLLRLSQILKIDPLIFSSDKDGQLFAEIKETLQDPLFDGEEIPEKAIANITSEFPDFCTVFVRLYKAYKNALGDLQYLNERLSQDSLLADSSFRLRTLVTSILSLTEIMHDNEDLKTSQRQEFLNIVLNDSLALTDTVNEMLGFISGDPLSEKGLAPSSIEAVTDFIQSNNNYFADIEEATETVRNKLRVKEFPNIHDLTQYLAVQHGVSIEYADRNSHEMEISLFEERQQHLTLSRALPPSSVKFHLALLIGQLEYNDLFDSLLINSDLSNTSSKEKGKDALANYFAGACLFPYETFYAAAEEYRYDIELLQQQFGASYEQICHRLTTLQRPEKSGIPFHLIRTDVAGNISKRFSASGLRIPRYGSACPRWIVHASLLTPGVICTQISEMPDGSRYFSVARTITKPSLGYAYPKRHYAISIGCDINQAHRLVYTQGMALVAPRAVMPVGIACRLCDREICTHRAAPPPTQPVRSRNNSRNISPGIGDW
ncbi:MAG: DUF2083 domain-containing protein [Sneathiella sp.]|nr:DUF2083 domain-containing protein [Sneathiella sp.]